MKTLILLLLCSPLTLGDEVALKDFTKGNNLFAGDIYNEIAKNNEGNFLVSPFSAETVLALAHHGSRGDTAEEMKSVLHLPGEEATEAAMKDLLQSLRKSEDYVLQTANKVYVKEKYAVKDDFKKVAVEVFGAGWENIDFEKKDEAVKNVNGWVEGQTKSKIRDILSSEDLSELTRLILINALYFKGNWSYPFDLFHTTKRNFYKTEKDIVEIDTLHHYKKIYNYYECSELDAKFLELPFEGGEVSMVIVLPNKKGGLVDIEKQQHKLFKIPNFTKETVNVALPKFKIESTIDFAKILKSLGMKKAFNGEEADLSGIAGAKGDLEIAQVRQKTFIEVSELGVEAAAATIEVVAVPISAIIEDHIVPKEFIVDHPFIFYIKYKDLILFAGRVIEPLQ